MMPHPDILRELGDLAGRLDPSLTPARAAARIGPLLDALAVGHCDQRANLIMVMAIAAVTIATIDRSQAAAAAE